MKIRYLKKRLKSNLIIGLMWLIIGIAGFAFDTSIFFSFGYFIFGLIYLSMYLFENNKQYLTIENGVITKNTIRPKSIKLDDIIYIKNFAGDYILKTKQDELTINKSFIEKNSLLELETVFESLNLDAKETNPTSNRS